MNLIRRRKSPLAGTMANSGAFNVENVRWSNGLSNSQLNHKEAWHVPGWAIFLAGACAGYLIRGGW